MINVAQFWKTSDVFITKRGKDLSEVESYRSIALLLALSRLFEKIFSERLKLVIVKYKVVPSHQLRGNHMTVLQVHRITDIVEKSLEHGNLCSAVTLNVTQALDRVRQQSLIHKIKSILSGQFYLLLKSYVTTLKFRINEDGYWGLKDIRVSVPQGSVLGPSLHRGYIKTPHSIIATNAEDTGLLAIVEPSIENIEIL